MDDRIVYDTVLAHTLENGDCVIIVNSEGGEDYLDDIVIIKDSKVLVRGYSHVTGDRETYILDWDKAVDLWMV